MGSSSRALRRPRRLQKRHLFTVAFLDASRNDFGDHLDLLGLDFGPVLDTRLVPKLTPTKVWFQLGSVADAQPYFKAYLVWVVC